MQLEAKPTIDNHATRSIQEAVIHSETHANLNHYSNQLAVNHKHAR